MKKKLAVLFSLVLLALVGLVARITYINATSGSKYRKQVLSQAQQKYENQTLPAKRGDIYDRNGNILATSNKVYNVVLDCLEVNKDQDSVEPTIKALVEVLGLDEDEMRKLLTDSSTKKSQYQIVKKQISMDDKKAFEKYEDPGDDSELTATQLKERSRITGVWFEEDYLRYRWIYTFQRCGGCRTGRILQCDTYRRGWKTVRIHQQQFRRRTDDHRTDGWQKH